MLKGLLKWGINQPHVQAGSCFKIQRGDFAGRLIEAVGFKRNQKGDMSFSELHTKIF